MKIVVDASVAIKWFLTENLNQEADRFLHDNYVLIAPNFLLLEVSNIVWKKTMRSEIEGKDFAFIIGSLKSFMSVLHPIEPFLFLAQQLAFQLRHPVYDCLYLATAMMNKTRVITADRKFYNRVADSEYSESIAWIENPPVLQ